MLSTHPLDQQKLPSRNISKGFTLIEVLLVVGILAVLLAITLIAINPARQFGNANNTARRSHVTQILNAIGQYTAENKGILPTEITALSVNAVTALNSATSLSTLCAKLVPTYIPALPTNPSLNISNVTTCSGAWSTGYSISRDANNRITVSADTADNTASISATR